MGKQAFYRRKNTLTILVVFLVVISMTSIVVNAADGMQQQRLNERPGEHPIEHHQGEHQGEYHQGEHHFQNWHEHRHHRHHDHYYSGTYYPDYEWVYES